MLYLYKKKAPIILPSFPNEVIQKKGAAAWTKNHKTAKKPKKGIRQGARFQK